MHCNLISRFHLITFCASLLLQPITSYAIPTPLPEKKADPVGIPMEDVQRFSNAIAQIKQYYVKPITDKKLFDNAIRGMLAGLDPHSNYLNEEEFSDLQTITSGEFGGLGIEVTMEDGLIKVITPLIDAPAIKAGVKSGDYIVKVDSYAVQGIDLRQAVDLMRGKVGEPVTLTVLRKGEKAPMIFKLVRENIQIKSVANKLLDNKYGYIRLAQFQALTSKDMLNSIDELKRESNGELKGLILDLRNNPGGLLDSAIQVADAFIDKPAGGKEELIVYTEGRLPGSRFTAVANPGDVLKNAPMVVLINNGSASASEIVAGALKDHKRAVIIGKRSFGKGSVQTVLPLDNKSGIKLTTALYYTPSGVSIQAQGIKPDIIIDEISVPKKKQANPLANFSEADLHGHLKNGKKGKNSDDAKTIAIKSHDKQSKIDEKTLLYEDYQLYSALTILKSLALSTH
ncbi:MAG: S41 family peptidase [Gammaproteobacteria bacterium]|nr:S41 family peptidase [Gammaproteobacteria bacterium]MCH9717811.1 S41 family peptidase [Gammaproteobacteria bacterium]MCH9763750.1 S41 family peptidase [Gammaproteobacteria bacterium]